MMLILCKIVKSLSSSNVYVEILLSSDLLLLNLLRLLWCNFCTVLDSRVS